MNRHHCMHQLGPYPQASRTRARSAATVLPAAVGKPSAAPTSWLSRKERPMREWPVPGSSKAVEFQRRHYSETKRRGLSARGQRAALRKRLRF